MNKEPCISSLHWGLQIMQLVLLSRFQLLQQVGVEGGRRKELLSPAFLAHFETLPFLVVTVPLAKIDV